MSKEELEQAFYDTTNLAIKLLEENVKLKKEIDRLNKIKEIKNNRIQQLMKRTRSARIDKAIEYIENNSLYEQDYDFDYEENLVEYPPSDEQAKKDLLSILKGSDKE